MKMKNRLSTPSMKLYITLNLETSFLLRLITMQHENAVRQKAATFVGRSELYQACLDHCMAPHVENSVMIIHGEPGCGKSALLAAVSKRCLDVFRSSGDFVFVHAVDTCPGSNNLETLLRNMQVP